MGGEIHFLIVADGAAPPPAPQPEATSIRQSNRQLDEDPREWEGQRRASGAERGPAPTEVREAPSVVRGVDRSLPQWPCTIAWHGEQPSRAPAPGCGPNCTEGRCWGRPGIGQGVQGWPRLRCRQGGNAIARHPAGSKFIKTPHGSQSTNHGAQRASSQGVARRCDSAGRLGGRTMSGVAARCSRPL